MACKRIKKKRNKQKDVFTKRRLLHLIANSVYGIMYSSRFGNKFYYIRTALNISNCVFGKTKSGRYKIRFDYNHNRYILSGRTMDELDKKVKKVFAHDPIYFPGLDHMVEQYAKHVYFASNETKTPL